MGLDAYQRHGGIHQDQFRTSKQERLEARGMVRSELEAMEEDADELWELIWMWIDDDRD